MGEFSSIEWTTHTFNPWIGCAKVSAGCTNCYAEAYAKRYGRAEWGVSGTRSVTSDANWRKPLAWNRSAEKGGRRDRVFCSSLADVFEDRPELVAWRAGLLPLIESTPHLDWLLLTKRPENAMRMIGEALTYALGVGQRAATWLEDHRNVWIGTSVEDQAAADERIPHLLRIPAAVRFLSMEPLLGPVEFSDVTRRSDAVRQLGRPALDGIDWVIVGGESGPKARPMHPDWARDIRDQCVAAGVPFFFKQWGGTDKKAAGRMLDGREWNEIPTHSRAARGESEE